MPSEHATRELTQRHAALWQASRAELAPVMEDRWWQEATPERIGEVYATAQAWEGHEEASAFLDRIGEQVWERYGVDVVEGAHVTT